MRPIRPVLTALVLLVAAGCATTSFTSKWRAPDAQPLIMRGQKVAAVVMTRNSAARRPAEDALAREITKRGATGIAAYTLVPEEQLKDMESVKRLLGEAGVEGVVSMRVVARDEQATVVPGYWTSGPYYGSFSNYWGYGWGTVYDPGYIQTDTIVSVETLVYSFRQDKLVWAGMSETMNPSRADALVSELAGRVASEMEKDGLLVAQ
jgi:hypothetical protein